MDGGDGFMPGMPMASAKEGGSSAISTCKTSIMLWNWNTVDFCLISSNWHIRSNAMFAGSCIAVAILAMSLSLLRRMSHEYDRRILKDHEKRTVSHTSPSHHHDSIASISPPRIGSKSTVTKARGLLVSGRDPGRFRPHLLQQLARGIIHLSQFVVAYFTMLIFMLLNGYLIISILVGIFLGYVVFEWESVELSSPEGDNSLE